MRAGGAEAACRPAGPEKPRKNGRGAAARAGRSAQHRNDVGEGVKTDEDRLGTLGNGPSGSASHGADGSGPASDSFLPARRSIEYWAGLHAADAADLTDLMAVEFGGRAFGGGR
jgi:hypothetical protein